MTRIEAYNRVCKIYQENLYRHALPLNYLVNQRKLTEDILAEYQVGYACGNLVYAASLKGGWLDLAIKYGLVVGKNDFFEGYATFPVLTEDGCYNIYGRKVAGFGSNHKTVSDVSKHIPYNLKATAKKSVVIVESPIDALTLLQNDINACALMGTRLKDQSVDFFVGHDCFVLFDKDQVGVLAGNNVALKLYGKAHYISVVTLPGNCRHKIDVNSFFVDTRKAKTSVSFLLKNSLAYRPTSSVKLKKKQKKIDLDHANIDIVAVGKRLFKGYIEKNGSLWVKCPHHKQGTEKNKSLWIGGKKNMFTCFGCNTSGTPLRLVYWHLGITPKEAVEWLKKEGFYTP